MLDEAALPGGLAGAERARALTLAREVLRRLGAVDAVLARFMKRPATGAGGLILRLGATELLVLGEAPHGAVDAAVRLAKDDPRTRGVAGLANAVLRRVAAEGAAIWDGLDHGRLATPEWLWRALRSDWGKAGAARIAAAHLAPPPTDLTLRDAGPVAAAPVPAAVPVPAGPAAANGPEAPGAMDVDWAAKLGGALTPTGSIRLDRKGQLSGLPGYAEGAWWAQDAAAAVPARLAGRGEGRRALDLCAAPGGKTMQLAAAGWRVTALDAAPARMAVLERNLARTGLTAEVVIADALDWDDGGAGDPAGDPAGDGTGGETGDGAEGGAGGGFDLVLLDAPCTATGTIRRHPDLPHIRDGLGLRAAAALQRRLLGAAWARVAPGGALIFCTCSLLKAEGEAQVNAFLRAAPDAARDPIAAKEVGDAALVTEAGDFRARPDIWSERGGLDGFFAARLRRSA